MTPGGINLVEERTNMGLSTRDAAKEMGITQAVLLNAEHGGKPQLRHAKRIADFYGYRVTDLWPVDDASAEVAA